MPSGRYLHRCAKNRTTFPSTVETRIQHPPAIFAGHAVFAQSCETIIGIGPKMAA
jgi:hypothetical protein